MLLDTGKIIADTALHYELPVKTVTNLHFLEIGAGTNALRIHCDAIAIAPHLDYFRRDARHARIKNPKLADLARGVDIRLPIYDRTLVGYERGEIVFDRKILMAEEAHYSSSGSSDALLTIGANGSFDTYILKTGPDEKIRQERQVFAGEDLEDLCTRINKHLAQLRR